MNGENLSRDNEAANHKQLGRRYKVLSPIEDGFENLPAHCRMQIPACEPTLAKLDRTFIHPSTGLQRSCIPVCEPTLAGNESAYVLECLESGWISSAGQFVKRFERDFAEYCGVDFAVSCSSGTTALHLALVALGVGPGDEVIVPTFTMIAVANAVRYCGATPILVDVDPITYNLDPQKVPEALTSRTKGIIAVHTYGHPADMYTLMDFANKHGLFVVEDAAEAHGARIGNCRVGGIGDVGVFSFYGNKTLTTGEGGMVITNNRELANTVQTLRDHAFSEDRHFWHRYIGFNYRITNLQAAVGVAQIERAETLINARRRNASVYGELLHGVQHIRLPVELSGFTSTHWMYAIEISPSSPVSRDQLRVALALKGIETRSYFIPIHWQPIYRTCYNGEVFPVAERLCGTGIYLPSSSSLSGDEIAYVAQCIRDAIQHK